MKRPPLRVLLSLLDWLGLIVYTMATAQFPDGCEQADEAPIKYLAPGKGKNAQGYQWTAHRPGGDTVYHWHAGRGY